MSDRFEARVLTLKPHLRAVTLGGQSFVIGERERFMLQGRSYEVVLPLLDGKRTVWDIVQEAATRAPAPEVYYALLTLEQQGYLAEVAESMPNEAAAFWHAVGVDAKTAEQRLSSASVAVVAPASPTRDLVTAAMQGAGIVVSDSAPLKVVLVADYLAPELETINREALEGGFPWIPVKPTGATAWFGPLFRPGEGSCWACLAHRLRGNRPVETFVARRSTPVPPAAAHLASSAQAALGLASVALAQRLATGSGVLDDNLLTVDLQRLRLDPHRVVRRPQCAACGDPELLRRRAFSPMVLSSQAKRFTEDGGHRTVSPEQTWDRFAHQVSPISGVIGTIGPVPDRDHPLRPVFAATYFVPSRDERPGFEDFSKASMGKGRWPAQARASALCEAIERHSAIYQGDEPVIRARHSELSEKAIRPDVLQNFSAAQYFARETINAASREIKRHVPLPFDDAVAIDWAPAWSLTRNELRYLPAALCYLQFPVPPQERFCYLDPNGHAAGNCLEEAILQGLFELAERDAVAIWWYNRLARPAVDLSELGGSFFRDLEAHYASLGHRLWVLDVTNDLLIPTFVAVAQANDSGRFSVGFGAHSDARLAAQRALTELNQLFDPTGKLAPLLDVSSLDDVGFMRPADGQAPRSLDSFPHERYENLRDDVESLVQRLAFLGLETIVQDQTRPDVGLNAVKVVVPGLRHFWPRLGPGRLYDIPVRLGWREGPLTESQLNPLPLFL